jgi:predicted esterase
LRTRTIAAFVGACLLAACSSGGSAHTKASLHVTSAGYQVPTPLVGGAPGALLASGDAPALARLVGAAQAWELLYHSTDLSGHDIAVSGMLLLPNGRRPATGWPLIAWAHGTSGLADQCAPSIAPDLGEDFNAEHELRGLLAHGFAVVASDYPGLGTPGVHTYLIGNADATAVIDSVTAAHDVLGSQLTSSWLTVGHSEGGQTSLFVAQGADRRAPQWRFLGTVAIAPASTLEALIPLAESTHDPTEQAYLLYALEGLSAVDPHVRVAPLLTKQAAPVLADTTTGCIDDIDRDLAHRHLDHLLAVDQATMTSLSNELARYDDPDHEAAAEPMLITQGLTDQDVPSAATDALATRLCKLGDHLDYQRYAGLDHNTVIQGSLNTVLAWISARFQGQAMPTTCPA